MNKSIEAFAAEFDKRVEEGRADLGKWRFANYLDFARWTISASSASAPEPEPWTQPVAAAPCPGNGTSYGMILTPLDGAGATDVWSRGNVLSSHQPGSILVCLPEFRTAGSWAFAPGYSDPSYVGEKLRLNPEGSDCLVISAFLNGLWAVMDEPERHAVVVQVTP